MDKKSENGTSGNEIAIVQAKIKGLFDTGRLSEPAKELLECALAISPEMFGQAVVKVITATVLIVEEKEAIGSAPDLIRIIRDAARKEALVNYTGGFNGDATIEEFAKILEVSLTALCDKSTYNASVVLDPVTYQMLTVFFKGNPAACQTIMVRVKNIYIPNNPEPSEDVQDFLRMLRRNQRVKLFEGAEQLEEFAENSEGTFVLINEPAYGIEAVRLVTETVRRGAKVICLQDLDFGYEDLEALDQAMEESPIREGSMFMLYKDEPVVKSIIFPPSFIITCCGGSGGMCTESIMILIS